MIWKRENKGNVGQPCGWLFCLVTIFKLRVSNKWVGSNLDGLISLKKIYDPVRILL